MKRKTEHPAETPPPPKRRRGCLSSVVTLVVALVVLGLIWVGLRGIYSGPFVIMESCSGIADGKEHTLKPSQTYHAATITSIAIERGLPARAATIALATARQESDLENINFGDRDSLGLFQQRPSQGWGTPAQVTDPVYAANKFYDGLIKIKGYETMEITKAADKVQRSAFPKAYADHEPEGRIFASALTGYSQAALHCRLKGHSGGKIELSTIAANLPQYAGDVTLAEGNRTLTITVPESGQTGWAVAHYTVAKAKAFGLVSVKYAGKEWNRDRPNDAWLDSEHSDKKTVVLTAAP